MCVCVCVLHLSLHCHRSFTLTSAITSYLESGEGTLLIFFLFFSPPVSPLSVSPSLSLSLPLSLSPPPPPPPARAPMHSLSLSLKRSISLISLYCVGVWPCQGPRLITMRNMTLPVSNLGGMLLPVQTLQQIRRKR